jgi:hypothetical protein
MDSAQNSTTPPPALVRVEDQIAWYDSKSRHAQRWFKVLKTSELIAAALVPFAAGYGINWAAGGLGVLIVVIEGLQAMNQYYHNWITYRSTCEELKHEKYLWLSQAGPYANANGSTALLAERIEGLISRENSRWVSDQEKTRTPAGAKAETA